MTYIQTRRGGGGCGQAWSLQLVPDVAARRAEVVHGHNLDHQACPARKVLRPLSLTRLRVVLLPCEARLLPAGVDRVDHVLPQPRVQVPGARLVRPVLQCQVLFR